MEFQKNAQLEQSSHEPLSVVPAAEVVDMEAGAQAEEAMISLDQMELGIRHAFARKVFTLLIVCIIILMATIAPFLYVTELRSWFRVTSSSIWVSVASGLLYLVACAVVSFWLPQKSTLKQLVGLFSLPIFFGVFLGSILTHVDNINVVWIALGITMLFVVLLLLFTFQTHYTFSSKAPFVIMLFAWMAMIGLFIGLSASGLYDPSAFAIVGIGLAIISLYLVYDVQLVLGGKHRTQFGVDDYLAATTALFSDFLVVFVLLICAAGGAHE